MRAGKKRKQEQMRANKYKLFLIIPILLLFLLFLIQLNNRESELAGNLKKHLKKISVVRVIDTPGHARVREYIVNELSNAGWNTELNSFRSETPKGTKGFKNIIASLNKDAEKFVVLSAHYDSKLFENFKFVGAFDSASSCSILIELAKVLKESFVPSPEWGLKIVLFDGEEALVKWTDKDSIYGAKHLSELWQNQIIDGKSTLSKIDTLVLLDLIGKKGSFVTSRFKNTDHFFDMLRAKEAGLIERKQVESNILFRGERQYNYQVQDDHIPFLNKGVPIVHLIPIPFPDYWHTGGDTVDKVHVPIMEKLVKVLNETVVEYTRN